MKFKFVISETENLFFFVSNLADWHFSCRQVYNEDWLKLDGPINDGERKILEEFGDLMRKHGFEYKNNKSLYLGRAFFVPAENKKWLAVRSMLNQQEVDLVERAFVVLKPRFQKVWYATQLRQWEAILNKRLKDVKTKNILGGIEKFLGAKYTQVMVVHLLASPSVKMAVSGGANLGDKHITLELPVFKIDDWNIGNAIAIMAHESAHTLVDKSYIRIILAAFLKKHKSVLPSLVLQSRNSQELLHELIADLCAPYGYFCSGTLGFYEPTIDILFRSLGHMNERYKNFSDNVVWAIYPLVAYYSAHEKRIDLKFLEKLRATIETLTV